MLTSPLLLAVLSSSLLAGVIGALIGGWFTLRGKRNDYANDYYKLVLTRRIEAYEQVERLIATVKASVLDKDGRPYHLLFSQDDEKQAVYNLLFSVMSKSLWLSDELFALTRQFNLLVYSHGSAPSGLIEFGKQKYKEVADLRTRIERVHTKDMLYLHEVPRFLKSKKSADSYEAIKASA